MPYKTKHPCNHPGCPNLVSDKPYCPEHERQRRHIQNIHRDKQRATFYATDYWRKGSKAFLRRHPICVCGCGNPATDVDHIIPWETWDDFADQANWQALAHACHSRKTALELKESGKWR